MLYVTFFFTVTLLIYAVFAVREQQRQRVKRRLAIIIESDKEEKPGDPEKKAEIPLLSRILQPLWKEFKKSFKRKMPGQKEARIEIKLLQAGRPLNMTPVDFRLLQIFLFIIIPVLCGLYGMVARLSIGGLFLLILLGIVAAVYIPHYYIKVKIKKRSKQGLRELPDVLDLLTVSLEAGLGFDSALSKLILKKQGILAMEFQRCLEEIRLGKSRREALTGVKDRLVIHEVRTLISSILQAEKLGIGMVQVLRVQSQEVREQRKQRAEEAAMKAPIKMLFPLVLFIFPCLFIVLLGPAVIQFIDTFSK